MKIIFRFLLLDLFIAIAEGVVPFTFVFLLKRLFDFTELLITEGSNSFSTFALLFSILPSIMILSLPMAILLSALMVYGRMSYDNEITALHAAGYSARQLLIPAIVVGLLMTFLLLWWSHRVAPKGLRLFRNTASEVLQRTASAGIKPGIFNDLGAFVFYPNAIESRNLKYLRLFELRNNKVAGVISAPTGVIEFYPERKMVTLNLQSGSLHQIPAEDRDVVIRYQEMNLSIGIPKLLGKMAQSGSDIKLFNNNQLVRSIKYFRTQYQTTESEKHKKWFYTQWKKAEIEKAQRLSLPFACLLMAIIGALLGMRSQTAKRSSCYSITVISIFVYYIFLSFSEAYVESNVLPAFVGMWIPNATALLFAIFLFSQTRRV